MQPISLVLATNNRDKTEEIRRIMALADLPAELLPRPDDLPDVEETGATLAENAHIKALAIAAHSGLPAISDDTGLEVAALDGAPGVYSSRYSGEHASYADNVAKLLTEMAGVEDRRAAFRTVAMVVWPDGSSVSGEGVVAGSISGSARGEHGFGYDPVFVPDECAGRTFAEMTTEEKNEVSHRGRAFRALCVNLALRYHDE